MSKSAILIEPSLTTTGGQGVNLTGYLDSPHMVFQYFLINSEAVKATIKEI